MQLQPRIIRLADAAEYCGMGKTMFNDRIRPLIDTEIQDGPGFVAFDRFDLDEAIDRYKQLNGISKSNQHNKIHIPQPSYIKEIKPCKTNTQDYSSTKSRVNGASTKPSKEKESDSVYKQALKSKLN